MQKTEVMIIGAGPGGVSAALFLAARGIGCILVDKEKFPRDKICGDALSGKVVSVLRKLNTGLVSELSNSEFAIPSYGVKFFAPNLKHLRIPFKNDSTNNHIAPGFISKRIDFDNFLFSYVKKNPLIRIYEGMDIDFFERKNNRWTVGNSQREILFDTEMVIAADGAQSRFARKFGGINLEPEHYCAGIRAYYENVKDMDSENFIELHFLRELLPGYLWIFPLPNGQANVGIGLRSDFVSRRKLNLKKMLAELIEKYPSLRSRFSEAKLVSEPMGYGLPLGSKRRLLSGDGYLLVGDAASVIDPFTGEGIGNAMISGMVAAEIAAKAISEKNYEARTLNQYDYLLYKKLGRELNLSSRMQKLTVHEWLFNFVVNKANSNKTLQQTISCMFNDLDLRSQLKRPSFYLKLLFG